MASQLRGGGRGKERAWVRGEGECGQAASERGCSCKCSPVKSDFLIWKVYLSAATGSNFSSSADVSLAASKKDDSFAVSCHSQYIRAISTGSMVNMVIMISIISMVGIICPATRSARDRRCSPPA